MKKRRLNPGSKRLPKVVKTRTLSAERLESREMFDRTTGLMLNTGESFPGDAHCAQNSAGFSLLRPPRRRT